MKKALAIATLVLVGTGYLLWRWSSPGGDGLDAADPGTKIFYDRLWVDGFPENPKDEAEIFAVLTDDPIGVFSRASSWRGAWEMFRHEPHGEGEIDLLYPQTGKKERAKFRAARCDKNGFDFCLEIKGASRGVARYFSLEGWELGGVDSLEEARARAAELLAEHTPSASAP